MAPCSQAPGESHRVIRFHAPYSIWWLTQSSVTGQQWWLGRTWFQRVWGGPCKKIAALLYADGELLVSMWPVRLQESLGFLRSLFERVGLFTNMEKAVGMGGGLYPVDDEGGTYL